MGAQNLLEIELDPFISIFFSHETQQWAWVHEFEMHKFAKCPIKAKIMYFNKNKYFKLFLIHSIIYF